MKTPLIKNFTLFVLGVIVALSASRVSAVVWKTMPTPTEENPPVPIYSNHPDQVKSGALSVNTFIAKKQAWFKKEFFSSGIITGTPIVGEPDYSTLYIGRSGSPDKPMGVTVVGTSKVYRGPLGGSIFGENIRTASGLRELCALKDGTIVLCDQGVPPQPPPPVIYDVYAQYPVEVLPQQSGDPNGYRVSLCLTDPVSQDENFTVYFTSSIANDASVSPGEVTILAGERCSNDWFAASSDQSAGFNPTITDMCVVPANPSITVDPGLRC